MSESTVSESPADLEPTASRATKSLDPVVSVTNSPTQETLDGEAARGPLFAVDLVSPDQTARANATEQRPGAVDHSSDTSTSLTEADHNDEPTTATKRAGFVASALSMALLVWGAGATLLLIRMSIAWIRLARILHRATPITSEMIQSSLDDVVLTLRARGATQTISKTRLLLSDQVSGPIATGLVHPCIVLPTKLDGRVTDKQLRAILLHETAHIARRDQLIVCLQNVVGAVFWIHPCVAMLNRRIAQAREEICDNHVLSETDAPTYSRTLLALAELITSPRPMPGAVGLFGSQWKLESRVAGLLDERRSRMTRMTTRGRCLVAAATVAFVAFAAMGTIQLAAEQQVPAKKDAKQQDAKQQDAKKSADGKKSADDGETKTDLKVALREATGKPTYASGTITNASGKAVAGAFVAVVGLDTSQVRRQVGNVLAEGVTDKEGNYKLTMRGVSSKTHRYSNVLARTSESGLAWKAIDLDAQDARLDLKLPPQQIIKVRLVDIEGEPVANLAADVMGVQPELGKGNPQQGVGIGGLDPRPKACIPALKTDDDGILTIPHVPVGHGVFVKLAGSEQIAKQDLMLNTGYPEQRGPVDGTYRSLVKNMKPGEVATLALSPAQWFEGVVLLGDSKTPAVNSKVIISSSQQEFGGSATTTEGTTDAKGRFKINPSPGVRFRIAAHPPAGAAFQVKSVAELKWDAEESRKLEINLPPGQIAQGKVVDGKTGEPLVGASVQYHPNRAHNKNITPGFVSGWQGLKQTDDTGSFSISILAGPGTLIFHAPEHSNYILAEMPSRELEGQVGGSRTYAHTFLKIEPSDDNPLEKLTIKLQPGKSVTAKVVDPDGKPVEEFIAVSRLHVAATSPIWRAHPQPGKNGQIVFSGLSEDEEYPVFVMDPKKRHAIKATISASDTSPTIKLAPCASANATFVYPDGKPAVEKMYVLEMVAREGANRFDSAAIRGGKPICDADYSANIDRYNQRPNGGVTDEQGRLDFLGLIPGATYRFVKFGPKIEIASEFKAESGKQFDMGKISVTRQ